MESVRLYLAVGSGAAIGALARYLVTIAIAIIPGMSVLWATAGINILGSLVIGFFATLTGPDGRVLVAPAGRQFVMSGLCGGFTTFSLASLDTFLLMVEQDLAGAALYFGLTIVLSLVAVWLGHRLARRING